MMGSIINLVSGLCHKLKPMNWIVRESDEKQICLI